MLCYAPALSKKLHTVSLKQTVEEHKDLEEAGLGRVEWIDLSLMLVAYFDFNWLKIPTGFSLKKFS